MHGTVSIANEPASREPSFVLLVDASSPEEAQGEATFLNESFSRRVRAVTLAELQRGARDLKGTDADEFFALLVLKGALDSRDEEVMKDAKLRLERLYRARLEKKDREWPEDKKHRQYIAELGRPLFEVEGLSAVESYELLLGLRIGPEALNDPYRLFSYEVSFVLRGMSIRVVLWCVNETFAPALYCSELKAAVFVHTFLIADPGSKGPRVCPQCRDQFWKPNPISNIARSSIGKLIG